MFVAGFRPQGENRPKANRLPFCRRLRHSRATSGIILAHGPTGDSESEMFMATYDTVAPPRIIYPESDGQPMADNTLQFRWIVTIQGGIAALFKDDPNVFVAGDLLWYAVEGYPKIRSAPDILVAFGRPKGERGSYQQWLEDHIAPQVVFEILSPGNRMAEMIRKFRFYEHYGVEEYYSYNPDTGDLSAWLRVDNEPLTEIEETSGWVSPRLGIRFEIENGELVDLSPRWPQVRHLYRA